MNRPPRPERRGIGAMGAGEGIGTEVPVATVRGMIAAARLVPGDELPDGTRIVETRRERVPTVRLGGERGPVVLGIRTRVVGVETVLDAGDLEAGDRISLANPDADPRWEDEAAWRDYGREIGAHLEHPMTRIPPAALRFSRPLARALLTGLVQSSDHEWPSSEWPDEGALEGMSWDVGCELATLVERAGASARLEADRVVWEPGRRSATVAGSLVATDADVVRLTLSEPARVVVAGLEIDVG